MAIQDSPKPMIAKTFRFHEETLMKLRLIKKAGKAMNDWVRDVIDKGIETELAQDEKLLSKVQAIYEAESSSEPQSNAE